MKFDTLSEISNLQPQLAHCNIFEEKFYNKQMYEKFYWFFSKFKN